MQYSIPLSYTRAFRISITAQFGNCKLMDNLTLTAQVTTPGNCYFRIWFTGLEKCIFQNNVGYEFKSVYSINIFRNNVRY